jgi:hypothetical protein
VLPLPALDRRPSAATRRAGQNNYFRICASEIANVPAAQQLLPHMALWLKQRRLEWLKERRAAEVSPAQYVVELNKSRSRAAMIEK